MVLIWLHDNYFDMLGDFKWQLCSIYAHEIPACIVALSHVAWWRHEMETFPALLALCAGNLPVNSPHKGQWRGALMFSFICAWINGWVNNREAGDLRRDRAHYHVIVMGIVCQKQISRAGTSNHIPQILWDVITCPCPWYLLLAHKFTCYSPRLTIHVLKVAWLW